MLQRVSPARIEKSDSRILNRTYVVLERDEEVVWLVWCWPQFDSITSVNASSIP